MKRNVLFTLILGLLFIGGTAFAQGDASRDNLAEVKRGAFNEILLTGGKKVDENVPYYFRHHKKLPTYFNGYTVELTTSLLPLRRDNHLFKKFGSVKIDLLEEGGFAYVLTGFRNKAAARAYLEMVAEHHCDTARIVYYKNGKRKVKR